MQQPVQSCRNRVGDDYQQRDHFAVETLVVREPFSSPISICLEHWLHLRDGQPEPPRSNGFDLSTLWQLKLPHRVVLVDCSADHPRDYRVVHHPNDVKNEPWLYNEPVTGRTFGELPSLMHSQGLQADYQSVKSCERRGLLLYSGIRQVINGTYRDYARLLLPFRGPDGRVDLIAGVHRLRQPKTRNRALFPWITVDTA